MDGQAGLAFENARNLVDLERTLGLFFEPGLQAWARSQDWILTGANWMYVNSHFVVTTTFLIWLYIARNHAYYFVRNMFMVAMGLALAGYVAYPTAPPRFMPEWGFTDSVAVVRGRVGVEQRQRALQPVRGRAEHARGVRAHDRRAGVLRWSSNRVIKALWAVYPLVVTFVVVVTANHFWIDAALGALVAAVSAIAASEAFARARPEAWAWRARRVKVPA